MKKGRASPTFFAQRRGCQYIRGQPLTLIMPLMLLFQ